MTHWLLANPNAGDGERGQAFWRRHLARAGVGAPECRELQAPGWQAEVQPGDVLMVAGGDGSVSAGAKVCVERKATLAVLPSGTANDFARNLGLPDDPDQVCALIARGSTRRVDVARFDDRLFVNVAHVGLGTVPVREAEDAEKQWFGRLSYGLGLLRRLNAKRGFRAEIQCDKGRVTGRWLSIAVASGAYFGGGNQVPEAVTDDGLLDVIAVKPRPLIQLLLTFVTVRLSRAAPRRTSTLVHLKGRHCRIRTRRPKTVTADGDVAGYTPLDIRCDHKALTVIAPSDTFCH